MTANTKVIHLSWDETVLFAQDIAQMIPGDVKAISSATNDSRILAMMVAEYTTAHYVDIGGVKVGLTDENADYCIYKFNREDFIKHNVRSCNEIDLEIQEIPTIITPPWKRF